MRDTNESRTDASERRTATHYVHYDPAAEASASELLVTAVADLSDTDPLDLEPLYETLDPDTVDDFVRSGGTPDVDGRLSFVFEGYDVRVHASGLLEIEPTE